MSYFYIFGTVSAHASQTVGTLVGDAENAGVDNAGVDNVHQVAGVEKRAGRRVEGIQGL